MMNALVCVCYSHSCDIHAVVLLLLYTDPSSDWYNI